MRVRARTASRRSPHSRNSTISAATPSSPRSASATRGAAPCDALRRARSVLWYTATRVPSRDAATGIPRHRGVRGIGNRVSVRLARRRAEVLARRHGQRGTADRRARAACATRVRAGGERDAARVRVSVSVEDADRVRVRRRDLDRAARGRGAGQLANNRPMFSPDGTQIAYSGVYDGNVDVYVIAATGGEPHRLTYHPGFDVAVGWAPDGKSIVFASNRTTERDLPQLWSVPVAGGPAERLPLPSGNSAAYSPDGKRLAYQPFPLWQAAWKHYRGGQAAQIWIADLATSHVTKVPRETSADLWPMWSDNTIYFVSDRTGPKALFAYDLGTNKVQELARDPNGFDITSAQIGPGGIVFDRLGQISIYDFASKQVKPVAITIVVELPQTRARFMPVGADQILRATISPTGKRVLVEAHGEVLSLPTEKGTARNLTNT